MNQTRSLKEKIWDFLLDGLWLDGVRLFFASWRAWGKAALGFVAAAFVLSRLGTRFPSPDFAIAAAAILHAAEIYFFALFFLREEPVGGKSPAVGLHPLLFVLAYVLALTYVAGALLLMARSTSFALFMAALAAAAAVFLYIFARLLPLAPLLVNQAASPVMAALGLTKGKVRRLGLHVLMLTLMLMPPYLLVRMAGSGLTGCAFEVAATGLYAALACAAYRVLYGEDVAARLGYDRRAAKRE